MLVAAYSLFCSKPLTWLVTVHSYYPQALRDVVDWYAATFKDKLMEHPPQPWFSSLVFLEVTFQLPFFFLAVYAILKSNGKANTTNNIIRGDGIFRSLCMIYGSSTATTLVPIFASIFSDQSTTLGEKGVLLGFYIPYLVFPLWLVAIAAMNENVFVASVKSD